MQINPSELAELVFEETALSSQHLSQAFEGGAIAFARWVDAYAAGEGSAFDLGQVFADRKIRTELSYLVEDGINPARLASRFKTITDSEFDTTEGWLALEVVFLSTAGILNVPLDADTRMHRGMEQIRPYLTELQQFLHRPDDNRDEQHVAQIVSETITATNVVSGLQNYFNITIQVGGTAIASEETLDPLRRDYLERLFNDCQRINWEGIDLDARDVGGAQLDLQRVYVPMRAIHRIARAKPKEPSGFFHDSLEPLVSVLNGQNRLILSGEMGSGKTTFADFLCLCLAGEALQKPEANSERLRQPIPSHPRPGNDEPENAEWTIPALLPARIGLKAFATSGQSLDEFLGDNVEALAPGFSTPFRRVWRDEGGMLLLDGFDEVPEGEIRDRVLREIERFARENDTVRILATTRPYALDEARWEIAGFDHAMLFAFNREQISAFIRQWYRVVAPLRQIENADKRIDDFEACLRDNESVANLATRPILLTLMASLHAWRGGTGRALPDKRHELYQDAVEMLIERWVRRKDIEAEEVAEGLRLGKDCIVPMLAELAHEVHAKMELDDKRSCADIPYELLREKMPKHLGRDYKPERVIEFLRERAGILVDRYEGKVLMFPHRSIQEYLAAWWLTPDESTEPPDLAAIAERGRGDPGRWREVVQLAAARLQKYHRIALVEHLLADGTEPEREWGGYLAGQIALESLDAKTKALEAESLHQSLTERMLESVRCGLPERERVQCGLVLGHLGDPRYNADAFHFLAEPNHGFVWIESGEVALEGIHGKQGEIETTVEVDGFWIHRHPVTNAMFRLFVEAGGYQGSANTHLWQEAAETGIWTERGFQLTDMEPFPEMNDEVPRTEPVEYRYPAGLDNLPVVGITWFEALAYCRWLSRQGIRLDDQAVNFHLPSDAQWQLVASGGTRVYPWGDHWDPTQLNMRSIGHGSPAGCYPGNTPDTGLVDCGGNVAEWTVENSLKGYPDEDWSRCAFRDWYSPYFRGDFIGFRVVASPSFSGL